MKTKMAQHEETENLWHRFIDGTVVYDKKYDQIYHYQRGRFYYEPSKFYRIEFNKKLIRSQVALSGNQRKLKMVVLGLL